MCVSNDGKRRFSRANKKIFKFAFETFAEYRMDPRVGRLARFCLFAPLNNLDNLFP